MLRLLTEGLPFPDFETPSVFRCQPNALSDIHSDLMFVFSWKVGFNLSSDTLRRQFSAGSEFGVSSGFNDGFSIKRDIEPLVLTAVPRPPNLRTMDHVISPQIEKPP